MNQLHFSTTRRREAYNLIKRVIKEGELLCN